MSKTELASSTSSSPSQPVLYSYWRSSCSWRVRIALNLKEIPYDIKAISLIKSGGEQHCNEYREVNPMVIQKIIFQLIFLLHKIEFKFYNEILNFNRNKFRLYKSVSSHLKIFACLDSTSTQFSWKFLFIYF